MARQKATAEELLARAESNGYKKGPSGGGLQTRREGACGQDQEGSKFSVGPLCPVIALRNNTGAHPARAPDPGQASARQRCLHEGVDAPDLATVKDFLSFHATTSRGKIDDEERLTADSLNAFAERFFTGFTRVTGTPTDEGEESEVYNWVRRTLTADGLVVNKRRPKHSFSVRELTRVLITLWTKDDPIFIPERYRLQFTFNFPVYYWNGARLGAFFTGGLCYRDVDLVLQRTTEGPRSWKLIYQISQR